MVGAGGDTAEERVARAGEGSEVHVIDGGGRGKDCGELGHGVEDTSTDNLEDVSEDLHRGYRGGR